MKSTNKKIFFLYPNTANTPAITLAIPIFAGISKERNWDILYFDTTFYKKGEDSIEDKEKTGGFMAPVKNKDGEKYRSHNQLISDLQSRMDEFQPDILCISAMSCEFEYLMTFLPKIKISDKTMVIIGGVHCILSPEDVIKESLFDLVCIGQGEAVFEEILIRKENNGKFEDLEGIYFKNENNEITRNNKKRLLPPDQLWKHDTDYSLYGDEYFIRPFDDKMVKMFWMEVGRGCPWQCGYCGNSAIKQAYKGLGKYICNRPMDSTFKSFKHVIEKYNIDIFNFTAECFLSQSINWLKEFADRYSKEVRKAFLIQTRSETVTEEKLEILKSFGAPFFQVGLGVESGNNRVLNDICNRRSDINDIIRVYDLLNKHNIRSNAYFIIGFPTETREEIFETIALCRRINSDINSVNIFQPLPGIALTKMCIDKGYMTGKEPFLTFTGGSVLKMPQISEEEIKNLRRVFLLYAKLPEEYHEDIKKCEFDYENNKELFDKLVKLRWQYDKSYKIKEV